MPEMIATSEIEYPPGRYWRAGDRFQVEEADAKVLAVVGRAKFPEPDAQLEQEAPPATRATAPRAPKAR